APVGALVLWAAPPRSARLARVRTLAVLAGLTAVYVVAWMTLFPSKAHLVLSGLGGKLAAALLPLFVPLSYERAGSVRALVWLPLVAAAVAGLGVVLARRGPPRAARLFWLGLGWVVLTLPPVFGLRDPDIH